MATAVSQPTHEPGVTALTLPVALDGRGDQAASGAPGRDTQALGFSLETEVERRRDSLGWKRESNAVTMREQEHPEIFIG